VTTRVVDAVFDRAGTRVVARLDGVLVVGAAIGLGIVDTLVADALVRGADLAVVALRVDRAALGVGRMNADAAAAATARPPAWTMSSRREVSGAACMGSWDDACRAGACTACGERPGVSTERANVGRNDNILFGASAIGADRRSSGGPQNSSLH